MNSTDVRNMTWEELRGQLDGARERVWDWLMARGPATTEAIADGLSMNLLTVRPRVSELVAMGFVECCGREKRQGIYRAVPIPAIERRYEEAHTASQLDLKF